MKRWGEEQSSTEVLEARRRSCTEQSKDPAEPPLLSIRGVSHSANPPLPRTPHEEQEISQTRRQVMEDLEKRVWKRTSGPTTLALRFQEGESQGSSWPGWGVSPSFKRWCRQVALSPPPRPRTTPRPARARSLSLPSCPHLPIHGLQSPPLGRSQFPHHPPGLPFSNLGSIPWWRRWPRKASEGVRASARGFPPPEAWCSPGPRSPGSQPPPTRAGHSPWDSQFLPLCGGQLLPTALGKAAFPRSRQVQPLLPHAPPLPSHPSSSLTDAGAWSALISPGSVS